MNAVRVNDELMVFAEQVVAVIWERNEGLSPSCNVSLVSQEGGLILATRVEGETAEHARRLAIEERHRILRAIAVSDGRCDFGLFEPERWRCQLGLGHPHAHEGPVSYR